MARRLKDAVRGIDVVFRYDKEEFTILLPETSLKGAQHVASNICKRLAEKPLERKSTGGSVGIVTASIGVTQYTKEESKEKFFLRVEDALIKARSQGRNCVVVN